MATLITGGTGFIGAEVARLLLNRGEDNITVFDVRPSTQRLDEIARDVKLVPGDLGNFSHVLDVVRQSSPEIVYHLGGMLSVPSEKDPQAAISVNAMGTFHVLEAARLFGVRKVIFTSSIGTYGLGLTEDSLNDSTLQRPQLIYGACKLFGEHHGPLLPAQVRNRLPRYPIPVHPRTWCSITRHDPVRLVGPGGELQRQPFHDLGQAGHQSTHALL